MSSKLYINLTKTNNFEFSHNSGILPDKNNILIYNGQEK